jgi:spermidine synthase
MQERPVHRFVPPGLLVCFFLSGAAGLIYQVVWSKALGLVFGHTAYAVATVLAVFLGGLAAGAAWLSRLSERWPRPVAFYGGLELGVAGTGAVSLAGLAGVRAVYLTAYPFAGGHAALLVALRVVGTALVLFIPTFLMGGTLPVLIRGLARRSAEVGPRLARLYWVNSAGAVAGTLAAGFFFLPVLGLKLTLGIAVVLNLVAGSLAVTLSRGESTAAPAIAAQASEKLRMEGESVSPATGSRFLLICFAIVGATAMSYEIGWTRLLSTQVGDSTYSFTLMLATFIAGIVLGSALFEAWNRRYQATRMTFAVTQTLTAAAALGFLIFFTRVIEVLPFILSASRGSFGGLVLAQFALSALAMLPAATVFGFNFPAVALLVTGRQSSNVSGDAETIGQAYAWNTIGAVAGAIATGFWLLPKLGSFHLLAATVAVNLGLSALLSVAAAPRKWLSFAVNIALLAAVAATGFSNYFYDSSVAVFNTALYWNHYQRPLPLTIAEKARLVDVKYLAEGLNATIAVTQTDNYLALQTNGKVDASNHDISTQLLLGHLGALMHPPRNALVIGFGSGMTASVLTRYPELERVDCIEIEPAVMGAAPLLSQLNRNVLQDPRVHIIIDDARNFLFTTNQRYDLIVSEPSNPWIAGVATLFTREFYRAAQAHLAAGGVFVQWVQAYSLFPDDLRMVLATFLSEFQRATLWHGNATDLILVAPSAPASEILNRTRALFMNPGLHEDFEQLGMEDPAGLFAFYMLDDAGLRKFSSGARLNTDDLTLLEYHAPRSLLIQGLEETNRRDIFLSQQDALPEDFPANLRDATLTAAAATCLNLQDAGGADHFVRSLGNSPVTLRTAIVRGRVALAYSNYESASSSFDAALAINPASIEASWGRAETDRRSGSNEKARQELLQILERDPNNTRVLTSLEQLAKDSSLWPQAEYFQLKLIALDPRGASARAYAELAELLLRVGDLDNAYRAMQDCLVRDPYNFQTQINLGVLLYRQKNWAQARQHLEFVRRFFPDGDATTYSLLYEVDNALGDPRAAAAAVHFGLRIFPANSDLQRLKLLL